MKARISAFLVAVLLLLTVTTAQVPEDRGAMGLAQALKRLDVVASVLHTGAHPDDENSALLAWLSRGQGVRTAYLSATRGDGGQNLLGPELFEALGVIRTEELLAARRFDHAQQFFTPNYEFGFSKTSDETFQKWGHEQVLGDFVRVIRQFKPEIIISAFTGTPQDGHGHHQVAGIITQEAFKVAADPSRFPEYGKPWQAKKLYLGARGNGQAGVTVNVGEFDQALGRSYAEIAAEGRSQHRSQAQGTLQEKGPRTAGIRLVQKTVDVADNADLFAGVLYKLPDLARLDAGITADLTDLEQRVTNIRQKASLTKPSDLLPDLVAALGQLRKVRAKSTNEHVQFLLQQKESDFEEAARLSAGLVLDVVASDDTVIPNQEFNLTASVINGGPYEFATVRATMDLPSGWDGTYQGSMGSLMPGQRIDQRYKIKVSANPDFTQPYWLREPRKGDRFVWPAGSAVNMPFDPPLLMTRAEIDYNGVAIGMTQPAEFRRRDEMLGEVRSQVKAVPALSVRISPDIAVIPLAGARQKEFTVTVENQNTAAADAEVRLVTPSGWTAAPPTRIVKFTRQGEKATVQFTVTAPATAGDFKVQAIAKSGSQEFKTGYTAIAYPHIETRYIYSPAESKVEVFDVKTRITSAGYVEGAGDTVPDALRQLGVNVTMLSPQDLAVGDLSRFPVIVMGIRAYGVREDVRANNNRLMEYVANGGTLIVQYNRRGETGNFQIGPYPFTINDNGRVTDEDAAVKILQPANPAFNAPNKIGESDFSGWVQERGNYFLCTARDVTARVQNCARTWDPQYVPLLESADPGEMPNQGGMIIAKYGKGLWVYTGYGFFRQLPAGVKGAYRLFANLVSLEN
jgi:LmbE family N-acetylglucosaminyl deacetylase